MRMPVGVFLDENASIKTGEGEGGGSLIDGRKQELCYGSRARR